jgi:hypothetical protein
MSADTKCPLCHIMSNYVAIMSNYFSYYFSYYVTSEAIIFPIMSHYLNYFFYYFSLFQGVTPQLTGAGRHTKMSYAQRNG